MIQVVDLFDMEVFKLYGMPKNIISDRGKKFISLFSQELFKLCGIQLAPSTSYHPQKDGQTKIVNKWVGRVCCWVIKQ